MYITTQLGLDNTVHSRISFDKGGVWEPVTPPSGSSCPRTEKVVSSHVTSLLHCFSIAKNLSIGRNTRIFLHQVLFSEAVRFIP